MLYQRAVANDTFMYLKQCDTTLATLYYDFVNLTAIISVIIHVHGLIQDEKLEQHVIQNAYNLFKIGLDMFILHLLELFRPHSSIEHTIVNNASTRALNRVTPSPKTVFAI